LGMWLLVASGGLYFVADSIFKQRASPNLVATEFDKAQYSLINFVFDIPGLIVGSYDRFIVPLLNLFVAATLAIMFTVLRPLEVPRPVNLRCVVGLTARVAGGVGLLPERQSCWPQVRDVP